MTDIDLCMFRRVFYETPQFFFWKMFTCPNSSSYGVSTPYLGILSARAKLFLIASGFRAPVIWDIGCLSSFSTGLFSRSFAPCTNCTTCPVGICVARDSAVEHKAGCGGPVGVAEVEMEDGVVFPWLDFFLNSPAPDLLLPAADPDVAGSTSSIRSEGRSSSCCLSV